MRDLRINTRPIYYAMLVGEKEKTDKRGLPTGQTVPVYSKPRYAEAFVSTPSGDKTAYPFGDFAKYDKIVATANTEFHADEYSVFWIDRFPIIKEDGTTETPHDYKTERVSIWDNQKMYAVSKLAENIDRAEYLKKLLNEGAITESEYNACVALIEDSSNED